MDNKISRRRQIERYNADERSNHWITAICFVLLAISGLAMFHPAFFWMTALLGGGQWTRILHPFIGLVMAASFAVLAARLWQHNRMQPEDRQWLEQMEDVLAQREDKLPPVGKYNAGQKLLFYTLVVCMALLFLSGIVIWRAYFSLYFPVEIIRLAALLHAFCAWVLIMGIIVHVYAAIWVKGSIGAMMRGTVSLGWARKHHRAWLDELLKKDPSKLH
jgi:formate dehydrogenase subunit gamma